MPGIISAGQSDKGMMFAAEHADYNFLSGGGENEAASIARQVDRLNAATAKTGLDVKALALIMVIADETDEAAYAKWEHYKSGTDHEAIAWRDSQAGADKKAEKLSTAGRMLSEQHELPTNMARFIGSYATVAAKLDELAAVEGLRGVMLTFDDFVLGIEDFGTKIQPLMKSRVGMAAAA
jgi:pyrimidine oxygenase